jgi:anti-repressor protein
MSNKLEIFNNNEFGDIRVLNMENDLWFIGKEISKILGYKETSSMRKLIDRDDYKEINPQTIENTRFVQNGTTAVVLEPNTNIKRMLLINESGLYTAIFNSKLENAKKFKKWVTSEVLPSIRKHGMYMTDELIYDIYQDPRKLGELFLAYTDERDKVRQLEQKIEEDKSKVILADAITHSSHNIKIGELAKLICQNGVSIGQNRLFKWMRENGYLMNNKANKTYNLPLQRYVENGYFKIHKYNFINSIGETDIASIVYVTPKGQEYFINKFLNTEKYARACSLN